ncbi:hypothetical protein NicSoilC5_15090 [Arthrobacter sp. NicSoilC5]|nr:hypothetical protein NicSoilC5_15090 [Arthrobacter sp. NicSoilC5]
MRSHKGHSLLYSITLTATYTEDAIKMAPKTRRTVLWRSFQRDASPKATVIARGAPREYV